MNLSCTFVTGGARSGKSAWAERTAQHLAEAYRLPVTFLATAERSDPEMDERISRHRADRPDDWRTVEEPLQVADWISRRDGDSVLLLDCLSLLLNNWMFRDGCTEDEFLVRRDELVQAIRERQAPTVIVSNEVGLGLVPEGAASRQYRDWLGWLNQSVAAVSDSVVLVVSGIAVDVKKLQVGL